MLDRTIAPDFQKIEELNIPEVPLQHFRNGIPYYAVHEGSTDVVRVEWIYQTGLCHSQPAEAAWYAFQMLTDGAAGLNAREIASKLDFYGAELQLSPGRDISSITLYCLERFLPELLPLVQQLLRSPSYPAKELKTLKSQRKQQLKVNLEKTAYQAGNHFRASLFGYTHPYGYISNKESIEEPSTTDIHAFWQAQMQRPDLVLFCGKVNASTMALIEQTLVATEGYKSHIDARPLAMTAPVHHQVMEMPKSVQSTIRMGWMAIPRKHEDFPKLMLANELFGGYFGSRLMQNIREEKGLTYGIYSSIVHLQKASYQVIGSDVKKENTSLVIAEIQKEIQTLKEELVPADELEKVKNYMTGSLAMQFNNGFSLTDYVKTAHLADVGMDYYRALPGKIHQISAEDIRETVQRYFDTENVVQVIAGGLS